MLPALGLLVLPCADAQTANPARPPQEDEILVLSPFVVTSESETGYVATSSLAGSRVKSDLKDIASQIDVLTTEFLEDIGASTIADAVLYSSNFGGPRDQAVGANDTIVGTSLEGRARGMDNATVSTDFFATNLPIDFYNIERLNLAYGAQSVLFGLGNAGGVLDSATKRAQMRNRASITTRVDSWGSVRGVLDANQVLIRDKLAIRLVGMGADAEQFIDGGRYRSTRGYGALTFRPFKKTTVRANYEEVDLVFQGATNYLTRDFVSPWFAAGRPLFDNSRGPGATLAATDPLFVRNTNALRTISYSDEGLIDYRIWNGSVTTKGPHQVPGAADSINVSSLIDGSIFPTAIDPRVMARQNNIDGRQYRAAIEQMITDELFFELAFNHEERNELSGGAFQPAEAVDLRADPNMYLPGGTAAAPQTVLNPNAGRLYIEAFPQGTLRYDLTQELRLTGFYEFKAARHLGHHWRWLGRHRLATLLSSREDRNESQGSRAAVVGNASFTTGGKLDNSRLLRNRYYLDSPRDTSAGGNYQATPLPNGGNFGPWVVTDPVTNAQITYAMFDNPDGRTAEPAGTKLQVDTAMAALQSFFLNDRMNLFVGIREDRVKTFYFDNASVTRRDHNVAGDRLGLYKPLEEASYKPEPDAVRNNVMKTYGAVVHPLSWLSFFYNTSENAALPPGRFGPDGQPLGGTLSDGYDYGVRFSLLRDRVSVRVNFYEDNQKNYWDNPFTQLRDRSAQIEQRLRGDDRPEGIAPVAASTFDPIARPVGLYRSLSNKTSTGTDVVVVANLTPNWTLRGTVGQVKNRLGSRGLEWIEWIEDRLPVWQDAGGLGWDNVTIDSTSTETIHQFYDRQIVPQAAAQRLATGVVRLREREWRANAFTNYRFTSGLLKGFNLGGGVRWWGPAMTGHGGQVVPGIATLVEDASILYKNADAQTFVDLLVGYRYPFKMGGRNRMLNLQVNVRNLFDEDDISPNRTNFAGVDYEYVRVESRQVSLQATLTF